MRRHGNRHAEPAGILTAWTLKFKGACGGVATLPNLCTPDPLGTFSGQHNPQTMPDNRRHRGPHPHDHDLFSPEQLAPLRAAVGDYSWLLDRDYSPPSALKLVGDRYRLAERQRTAVMRCAAPETLLAVRRAKHIDRDALKGATVAIDGFNVLTTVEAAMSGGVILQGRDGCRRDMASMHGSWRRVDETRPAAERIGEVLASLGVAHSVWLLDSPVSNSGRLAQLLRVLAETRGWSWTVDTVASPDRELKLSPEIVVTADSAILDSCGRWFDLAATVVETIPDVWHLDLRPDATDNA